jgi:hypothetical protein
MWSGTGAVIRTGGLFFEIGTTTSRACSIWGEPVKRGAFP